MSETAAFAARVPKTRISGYLMIYKVEEGAKFVYIEHFFGHLEDYESILQSARNGAKASRR